MVHPFVHMAVTLSQKQLVGSFCGNLIAICNDSADNHLVPLIYEKLCFNFYYYLQQPYTINQSSSQTLTPNDLFTLGNLDGVGRITVISVYAYLRFISLTRLNTCAIMIMNLT